MRKAIRSILSHLFNFGYLAFPAAETKSIGQAPTSPNQTAWPLWLSGNTRYEALSSIKILTLNLNFNFMKRLLLLNSFLLFIVLSTYSQWQKGTGPYGGIVKCFAKTDKYIIAGCDGNESGVFISIDNGNTWNKVIKTDKPSWQIPDFMVNEIVQKDSTETFYVASAGEGIYKLLNNNGTWELKNLGFRSDYKTVHSVAYKKGNIFVAFYGDGIYKTGDEGKNWGPKNTGLSNKYVVDLRFSGDSIYAATTDGLFVSKNMGDDWKTFSPELTGKYVTNVFIKDTIICLGVFNEGTYSFSKKGKLLSKPVVIPNKQGIMPLGLINGKLYGSTTIDGLFVSDIPGINWQKLTSDFTYEWPHCIIDCKDTLLVGVNGFGVYRSANKGLNWKESSEGMSAFKFTSIASIDSTVYAATDINGVFLTKDKGKSWQRINKGLGFNTNTSQLIIKDTVIYLAANSIYTSTDKGANWKNVPGIYARSLASNGKTVYASCFDCGINATSDNGKTWQHVNYADSSKFIWDIDARDSIILVGTQTGGPICSLNYGKTWKSINEGLSTQTNTGVLIKDNMFFITGDKGIFRSSDRGKTWEAKNNGLCCIPSELISSDSVIFGTFPQTIIYSYDNGDNWHYLSDIPGLSQTKSSKSSNQATIQSIGYSKDYLFAGTDCGFYYHNIKKLNTETGIKKFENNKYKALTNYPNPFKQQTTIQYTLKNYEKSVILNVYDNQGRIVYTLKEKNKIAGNYSIPFDADKLPSGFYYYSLTTTESITSNKMIVNK
jgi:photosystem II stability/assembly factor-like uncharacterized protein